MTVWTTLRIVISMSLKEETTGTNQLIKLRLNNFKVWLHFLVKTEWVIMKLIVKEIKSINVNNREVVPH